MGWKSKPPPPDPLIGQAAMKAQEIAEQELKWRMNIFQNEILPRQDKADALNQRVTDQLMSDAKESSDFSRELRNEWRSTYLPVERQSAQDAMSYDSMDNVGRRSGMAVAGVNQQFDNARSRAVEEMAKYGIRLDPGALASTMRRMGTAQAVAAAGAGTGAAFDTMDRGIALRANTTQVGRGLPAQSAQFLGASQNGGNSAVSNGLATNQGLVQGAGFAGAGFSNGIQANLGAANTRLQQWQTQVQASQYNPLMEAIGTGVGLYAGIKSSKKYKTGGEDVAQDDVLGKIKGLKVDRWAYKGDDKLHIGPYAEDLHTKFGVGNGDEIGPTDVGGIALAGVKQLADKVDQIGRRLGLDMERA